MRVAAPALAAILVCFVASPALCGGARKQDRGPLGRSTVSRVRCVDEDNSIAQPLHGSRSVGTCQSGYIYESVELPVEGEAYAVIPGFRGRRLNFATEELVSLVQRIALRVRRHFPGALLHVGNLSGRNGGPIRYSRSHQSGRDIDLAFYAVDGAGRPASPSGMPPYRCSGRGRKGAAGLHFDTARNWALIEALLGDEQAEVEVIFVARCLKRRLLHHAKAQGVDRKLRRRAAILMRDAGDRSFQHDDHFHVRIFCSAEDLSLGCRNAPRAWPWTRVHESTRLEDGKKLRRKLGRGTPMDRVATLQEVFVRDHKELAGAVVRLLAHPDPSVSKMARSTVRQLASPGALTWLRQRARRSRRTRDVIACLELMSSFEGPESGTARFLESLVNNPEGALSARPKGENRARVLVAALDALAFLGRRASVAPLVRRLSHEDGEVRAAAERALGFVTNHVERFADDASPRQRRRQWSEWWLGAKHRRWDHVLRDGFRRADVEVPRYLHRWDAVRPLYRAIARGGHLSWNAQKLLRRFARDNSPRIPHVKPELAQPMWKAWILSRLSTGAQL